MMKPLEYSSGIKSFALIWLFLLSVSACNQTKNAALTPENAAINEISGNGGPSSEIASTQEAGENDSVSVPIEIDAGTGDFVLADAHTGLDQLSSYTSSLVVSFSGTVGGEAQNWTQTYKLIHTSQPLATQIFITTETAIIITPSENLEAEPPLPIFLADVDDIHYEMSLDGTCFAEAIDPDGAPTLSQISLYDPASLIKPVFGVVAAGQEMVSGLAATHYKFDQSALLADGISQASGELWTASDSGILLKYSLTATIGAEYFGEGSEGVISWDYILTDIDTTVQSKFPEGCQLNVPLMADASEVRHLPYWLVYSTQSSSVETANFYQEELPALGWTMTLGPLVSEGDMFMEFSRGNQTIGVYIHVSSNGSEINIVLYRSDDLAP